MSASLTIEDIEDALRRVLDTHNRSPWLDSEAAAVYGGIDFKSKGGQVVAAGSIHPGTGRLYALDTDVLRIELAEPWR